MPNANLSRSASANLENQFPIDNQIQEESLAPVAAVNTNTKCSFCELNKHVRSRCPAEDSMCSNCGETGHFARLFKSMGRCSGSKGTSAAMLQPTLAAVTASSGCKAITDVIVNGHQVNALIDSGSSLSCIDPSLVHKLELSVHPESKKSNNKSFHTAGCYPLPNINDIVQKIAQYSVFSTIDLRRAYHQIPLKEEDKPYNTAFEASCGLYQFNRMPFGVTNGVAGFQRSIDGVITKENIKDTFAYVDNVTLCAKTQKEHDENLEKFLEAAKNYNMTFNEEKSTFSTDRFTLFGSVITKGTIKPDLERLRPLKELPPPQNITAQRHDINSSTVIKCLCQLFAIFGMPSYVHSDRGSSLISEELKKSSNKGEYCFTETPCGQPALNQSNNPGSDNSIEHRTPAPEPAEVPVSSGETVGERIPTQELRDECVTERLHEPEQILRRSECIRRPPDKLNL
eukprot:gene14594-16102_t